MSGGRSGPPAWLVGLFRTAALAHPADVRDRYGREMAAAFRAGWADRRAARGAPAATAWALRAAADAAASGVRERIRRLGGGPRPGEWWTDLKVAARALRRSPGFTAAAVLVLALGIGANTAVFSAVKATLLASPPFPDPADLVLLELTDSSTARPGPARAFPWSYPKYQVLASADLPLASLGAYAVRTLALTGAGDPRRLDVEVVTPRYLDVLGAPPALGRGFQEVDDVEGAPPTVILGARLWRERFGSDPAVVGRDVTLNGRPATVLGVAPSGFRGLSGRAEAWVSVHTLASLVGASFLVSGGQAHWLSAVARLEPGADPAALQARMPAVGRAAEDAYPDSDPTVVRSGRAEPLLAARVNPQARRSLLVLAAAAALLLLVGCANLAGLLLARAAVRARETAVRVALGAGRWRVARGVLAESLLIALVGGAAALAVAWLGAHALVAAWPERFLDGTWNVRFTDPAAIHLDGGVLGFAAAVALATGLLFGVGPALAATRGGPGARLKEGSATVVGRGQGAGVRRALVAGEIALALVLLVGAGLLLRSLQRLQAVDRGYRAGNLVAFDYALPRTSAWADDPAAFHAAYLERLRALPGVVGASLACSVPVGGHCWITGVRRAGERGWEEGSRPSIGVHPVDDDYFTTLGIPVLRGRALGPGDRKGAPVAVVLNQAAVRALFPDGDDPLSAQVSMGVDATPEDGPGATVVGVVGDVLYDRPDQGVMAEAYFSYRQEAGAEATVLLRTRGDPLAAVPAAREALAELDPTLPVSGVRTVASAEADATADTRSLGVLLALFAALAGLLACTGVWAVVAYTVERRTREFGLRVALGADPRRIVRLVVAGALTTATVGVALGAVGGWAATRILGSFLYEVSVTDPPTFLGGAAALLVVSLLAAWLPARRATRVDPVEALRAE